MIFAINKKKFILSIAIGVIAFVGDRNSEGQKNGLAAAICDNVTHGLIGALTWVGILVTNESHSTLLLPFVEIALCGFLSSVMDVDHFLAARSFHLKDAVKLKSRPPMHCTTLVLVIVFFLLGVSNILRLNWLYRVGWILAAAFISHHIRDSKRRGLWLWPFGTTSPIPVYLYLAIQMLLPHIFSVMMDNYVFYYGRKQPFEDMQLV